MLLAKIKPKPTVRIDSVLICSGSEWKENKMEQEQRQLLFFVSKSLFGACFNIVKRK